MARIRFFHTVFVVIFVLLAGSAQARNSEFNLKPASPEVKAYGTVEISHTGFVPFDRLLEIYVTRLEHGAVYSVWLLDTETDERSAAGLTGQNNFDTGESGNAHYTAYLSEFEIDWRTLQIAYHPDGDASNTRDMVVVLTVRLYE
ncbi:MAG: hypothetical protein ACE5GY_08510 [Thermodesulfobacteriota bacterium]